VAWRGPVTVVVGSPFGSRDLVSNVNVRTAGTFIRAAMASPVNDLAWLTETASATGGGGGSLEDIARTQDGRRVKPREDCRTAWSRQHEACDADHAAEPKRG